MKNYNNPLDENFSYGYDGLLYNLRTHIDSKLQCYYRSARYIPNSFQEECIKICEKIDIYCRQNNRTPVVLLSGGLDSEIVVRSFIDSGVDFRVVSNRFDRDLNSHEIFYIERLSKELDFEIEYIDIDIENLIFSPRYLEMAEISKCAYSEMLPTMDLIDRVYFQMNGVPILGNGDFYAKKINDKWQYVEFEYILSWMRYCVGKNIIGSINFFQQTPEVVLAMAIDGFVKRTIEQNVMPNIREAKYLAYRRYWKNVEIRSKFNGSEKIQNLCDNVNEKHLKKFSNYTEKWTYPLKEFIEQMYL